jgi:hypothetical protein
MPKIQWSPKLRQSKIWQLYQNDALGMVDETLVEEVGYGLLARCKSVWLVTRREVECAQCGAVFTVCQPGSWKPLPGPLTCPTPGCGWQITHAEWHESWRHRDLLGTAAFEAVETYLRDYPRARSPEERMVCIDQLIHAFHISLRTQKPGRSFANNLIEGSHKDVVAFLDRLFALPGGVDKGEWRTSVDGMWKRRRGQEDGAAQKDERSNE